MEQVAIIPSGVNQLSTCVFATSEAYLCYASTLAVYVHANKAPGFPLLRVLTGPSKPIIAISYDGEVLVAVCADKQVFLWELITGECLGTTEVDVQPTCVAASSHLPQRLFIGGTGCKSTIWLYREGKIMGQALPGSGDISCCAFSVCSPSLLGVGTTTGLFLLYDMLALRNVNKFDAFESLRTGGFFEKMFGDSPCINSLGFDPRSQSYAILASATGYILLIDIEKMAIMHTFDRCNTGVSHVMWNPAEPGGFLTMDGATNTIRCWNVSSRAPLTTLRPRNLPVTSCCMIPPQFDSCLVGFDEGSVGVFNMALKRLEMSTLPGHSETVFDVRFAAHDRDLLSSGSFDRTVKIWNVKSMSLQSTFAVHAVAYCLDWAPDGSGIAVSLHTGEVAVLDPRTEKVRWKRHLHRDLAWRVSWCVKQPQLVASSSRDHRLCVMRASDGELFGSLDHKAPVFGISWSPVDARVLATGCFDGKVRILQLSDDGLVVQSIFSGHSAECYNVEFNPLVPHLIASTSNDKTVRVWNLEAGAAAQPQVLVGHTDKVRGLCWCPAVPHAVLSGSWDGTIRMWDVRSGRCVAITHNHSADVYSIATHPARPFIFVSGSRDTTLRFWRLKMILPVYINAAIGSLGAVRSPEQLMAATSASTQEGGVVACATGPQLAALLDKVSSAADDPIERLAAVSGFFDFPYGAADVVNCVRYLRDDHTEVDKDCVVSPMNVLAQVAEARAKSLEAAKSRVSSAVGSSQLNAKLVAAAETYLRLGRVREFCELMIDAGEWDRGIAAAPMVSLDYWRSLCARAAGRLAEAGDLRAVDHFICASEGHAAADFLASRKEYTEAMLVVQHCPQRADNVGDATAARITQLPPQVDAQQSLSKLGAFARVRAEAHIAVGNPNLAAAAIASAGIIDEFVASLVRGGSGALAHLVVHALPVPNEILDLVFNNSMVMCAALGDWTAAATCCHRVRGARSVAAATLLALFRASVGGAESQCAEFAAALLGPDEALLTGSGAEASGSGSGGGGSTAEPVAIAQLVLQQKWGAAINNAVAFLEDVVAQLQLKPCASGVGVEDAGSVPTATLEAARTVACQVVFDGDDATARRVMRAAFRVGEALARRYGFSKLGPSMLAAAMYCEPEAMARAALEEAVRRYQTQPYSPIAMQFSPLGSHLPSNKVDGKRAMSFVTDLEVSGPQVILEDGEAVISAHEAQLWHHCCWFTPLATGERMYPYH